MRTGTKGFVALLIWMTSTHPGWSQESGKEIYLQRCVWCHGEKGTGDGPSAGGMIPRPRDFVRAEYKIRSTPHGQLPTRDDIYRTIANGFPGTPMPGWKEILTDQEIRKLVEYLKSLSPRFQHEKPERLTVPTGPTSIERGKQVYQAARCFMCHGRAGRGDGGITTTIHFEWGIPYTARDFTRGWTFKGGHEPRDIYLRITGGLNNTPMGPYRDLLTDQERWDLAHYIASLDQEPGASSDDFVVAAAFVQGGLPKRYDAPQWQEAQPVQISLAGQVILDPPLRWWIPTASSATVRALWNRREIGFLLEWNDPTGPENRFADSALLQFPVHETSRPYFILGDKDHPVKTWNWQVGSPAEEWTANGPDRLKLDPVHFRVSSAWHAGRWHVIFRRALLGSPSFRVGDFLPMVVSVRDGANGEIDQIRALSTWLFATLKPMPSLRSWRFALACFLAAILVELWVLYRPHP